MPVAAVKSINKAKEASVNAPSVRGDDSESNPAPEEADWSFRSDDCINPTTSGHLNFKKKDNRTVKGKELEEWTDMLQSDINAARTECTKLAEEAVQRLQVELEKLGGRIETLGTETDEHINRVGEEATHLAEGCNVRTDQEIQRIATRFDEHLAKERESYSALDARQGAKLTAAEQRLDEGIRRLREELLERLGGLEAHMGGMFGEYEKRLDSVADSLRAEIALKVREASEAAARDLAASNAGWEERVASLSDRLHGTEATLAEGFDKLHLKVHHAAVESRNLHHEGKTELFDALTRELSQHDGRLGCLEEQVQVLDLSVAAAANVPTRRVEWAVPGVMDKAFPAQRGRSDPSFSWRSEDFDIAGANGLRLELQHLPGRTGRLDRGDCVMYVWAPAGLFLIFKLLVGDSSVKVEHSFHHGEPYHSHRLCFLEEQVSPDDDSLRIGIEVLEAVSHASDTRSLRRRSGGEQSECGEMHVSRYLNHRVLELVQGQVDTMTSRMVGRIEWRVEQASSLRRYFAEGESICSSTFDAASLHNLQFVFYPVGYHGARDGFCSLFLYCPDGSLLKCWLSVGKVRREVRLSSEHQGYLGRTNFCRLDSCVGPDDSILLSLEIVEAQRSNTEALVHQLPADTAPRSHKSGVLQPSRPCEVPEAQGGGQAAINSTMRLQQTPAGRVLEDVKLLPSIWTPTAPGSVADSLEGFHQFGSIKSVKTPVSSRHAGGALEIEQRMRTTPRAQTARRYDMYM